MSATAFDVLMEARLRITPRKMWRKGALGGSGEPNCLDGALLYARNALGASSEVCQEAAGAIEDVLDASLSGRRTRVVFKFNDDPNTTHADVLLVLDAAMDAVS